MPRWMPSQPPPLKRKSICLAEVAEPISRAPVSFRFSRIVLQPRKTFFPSCSRTAMILPPYPALQRLRKNSTSASSGTLLDADHSLHRVEKLLRVETHAVLEHDLGLAECGDVCGRLAVDDDELAGLA